MPEPWNRIGELLTAWWTRTTRGNTSWVAVVSLALLALLALVLVPRDRPASDPLTDLFPNRQLTSYEVERIEAALGQSQLSKYQIKAGKIWVPQALRGECLSAISEAAALPDSFHAPTEAAISKSSVIETARQRSQRLHHALEKEARLAICALPGVLDAFVHIDVAVDSSLHRRTKATAVVGVKTDVDQPLDEQSFRTIQAMLLNFKAGLTPESVTVTDLTSRQYFLGSMDQQPPEVVWALRKADLEREWKRRLASAISFVPQANLTVNVVPVKDGSQAESVTCSISVPLTLVEDQSPDDRTQYEKNLRQRVQAAVLPLLPRGTQKADELVAVTVFDHRDPSAPVGRASWRARSRPHLLATVLVAVAGMMALLLIRNPTKKTKMETHSPLRIYEGDTSSESDVDDLSAAEQLQSMAVEDPRAVAESLTDFIDRAS